MAPAYYVAEDKGYVATELTRGPWNPLHQHGGPPTALMAREAERMLGDGMRLVRITSEFLRPIPIGKMELEAKPVRAGKTTALVGVALYAGGSEVARATVLAMSRRQIALPAIRPDENELDPPDRCPAFSFPFFGSDIGYHTSVELRLARGTFGKGPVAMWFRVKHELVAGEALTPTTRVLVPADSGNGISPVLDYRRFLFINPDLSVHLLRPPAGEWVALESRTDAEIDGVGLADTRLRDERGVIGHGCQSLLVDLRR